MSVYQKPGSPFWQFDFQIKCRRFFGTLNDERGQPLPKAASRKVAEAREAVLKHEQKKRLAAGVEPGKPKYMNYSDADRIKLSTLLSDRRQDFLSALHKFVVERRIPDCLPVSSLVLRPTLIFRADTTAPPPTGEMSYLRIKSMTLGYFEGALEGVRT